MGSHKKGTAAKDITGKKIDRLEIRVSGAGGQGIISTGMILGEAIAIGDEKNVAQSQSYGPEARGGATRADIIVSDGEIFFPECHQLDILLAFTPEAYEKYSEQTKSDGLVIADTSAASISIGLAKTIKVPFLAMARDKFKRPIVANLIALGFMSAYTNIVSHKSLRDTVEDAFSASAHLDTNLKALDDGYKLGKSYLKEEQ